MAKHKDTALVKFLRAWLAWAEKPGRRGKEFSARYGLCTNADRMSCASALKYAFIADGLSTDHPFGYDRYWHGYKVNKHKDPVRLAWVRYYLARFDAGLFDASD